MKREELRAMGLTEEQVNAIMRQNGLDIENAKQNSEAAQAERARADSLQEQLAREPVPPSTGLFCVGC